MDFKKIKLLSTALTVVLVLVAFVLLLSTNGSQGTQSSDGLTAYLVSSGTLNIFGGNGKVVLKGFGLVLEGQYYDYAGVYASASPTGIILFIGTIILLAGSSFLGYLDFKGRDGKIIRYSLSGVGIVTSILIVINPYIFKAVNLTYIGEETKMSLCGGWISALVLIFLASVITFVFTFFKDSQANNVAKVGSSITVSESEKIELLAKYKSLLDSGAITQEEFEEKKKALL